MCAVATLRQKGAVGLFHGNSVLVFIIGQTGNVRTPGLKQGRMMVIRDAVFLAIFFHNGLDFWIIIIGHTWKQMMFDLIIYGTEYACPCVVSIHKIRSMLDLHFQPIVAIVCIGYQIFDGIMVEDYIQSIDDIIRNREKNQIGEITS